MTDTFIVTDGSDDIDCTDPDSGYDIVPNGYRSTVAQRQTDHPEIFGHVDEEVRLIVSGDTPAEAAERLELLADMVNRADQLWRGESTTPVLFQYRIEGSGEATPQQSLVVGPPESGEVLQLPSDYDSATATTKIGSATDPVIWRWRRRGGLLGTGETETSGSVTNPGIMTTSNFSATPEFLSPTDIWIAGFAGSVVPALVKGFILLADDANAIFLDEAEDGTNEGGGGGSGTISDTAVTGSSGGNVVRIAPTGSISTFGISFTLTGSKLLEGKNIAFYAMIKNNSPDISYTAWAVARYGSASFQSADIESRKVTIPAASGPQMYYLGMVSLVEQPFRIIYKFAPDDASVGSGDELDVDYVAAISLADPAKRVLRVENSNMGGSGSLSLAINHRALEGPQPTVWETGAGPTFAFLNTLSYGGNPFYVSKGAAVSVLVLGTNGSNNWLIEDGGGSADALSILAIRYPLHVAGQ